MKQKRIGKKAVSWLLTACLVLGLLPAVTVPAAAETSGPNWTDHFVGYRETKLKLDLTKKSFTNRGTTAICQVTATWYVDDEELIATELDLEYGGTAKPSIAYAEATDSSGRTWYFKYTLGASYAANGYFEYGALDCYYSLEKDSFSNKDEFFFFSTSTKPTNLREKTLKDYVDAFVNPCVLSEVNRTTLAYPGENWWELTKGTEYAGDATDDNGNPVEYTIEVIGDTPDTPKEQIDRRRGGSATGEISYVNPKTAATMKSTFTYSFGPKRSLIKFEAEENGSLPGSSSLFLIQTDQYGSPTDGLSIPIPVADAGYQFAGWHGEDGVTISDAELRAKTVGEADQTWTAQFEPREFTVNYNSNGGTGSMDAQTFTYGEAQSLRENTFTYEHKVFGGWNEDENGLGRSYADGADGSRIITPTSDGESVTLYAQWNAIQYWTVTFHPNGGTFNGTNGESEYKTTAADLNPENYVQYPDSGKYSALATPPTRTGYTFAGWYDKLTGGKQIYDENCDLAVSGKDLILTSDTTLYARWTADDMSIDPIADQTYDGTDKKPGLTVKVGGATLAADKYAAVWENNTNATGTTSNPDKAKVTVYGLKEYAGMEQTAEFSIKQADQVLTFVPNDTDSATTTYGETFLNTAIAKYDPNAVNITYSLVGADDATEAEINANTGEITPLKGGVTVTVRASAGAATTDNVKAGSKEYTLTINKATPVLTFENDTIYGVRTGETKTNELIVTAKDDADAAELKTRVTYTTE